MRWLGGRWYGHRRGGREVRVETAVVRYRAVVRISYAWGDLGVPLWGVVSGLGELWYESRGMPQWGVFG